MYSKPSIQQELLQDIITSAEDVDDEEEVNPTDLFTPTNESSLQMSVSQKKTGLASLSGSLKNQLQYKHLLPPSEKPAKKSKASSEQHPFFKKLYSTK